MHQQTPLAQPELPQASAFHFQEVVEHLLLFFARLLLLYFFSRIHFFEVLVEVALDLRRGVDRGESLLGLGALPHMSISGKVQVLLDFQLSAFVLLDQKLIEVVEPINFCGGVAAALHLI